MWDALVRHPIVPAFQWLSWEAKAVAGAEQGSPSEVRVCGARWYEVRNFHNESSNKLASDRAGVITVEFAFDAIGVCPSETLSLKISQPVQ
jgi:hypothetical protein